MSDTINSVVGFWAAITAVATVAGVIVAALYARLTRTLASAALQQAQAAADQALITRRIFEASHRPVLGLVSDTSNFYVAPGRYRLDFDATNHGQVPAIVAESRLVVRRDAAVLVDRPVPGRGRCIFPGQEVRLGFEQQRLPDQAVQADDRTPVEVELTVSYTGFDDAVRVSRVATVGNFDDWTRVMTELR